MLRTANDNHEQVEILARSFAKNLIQNGFSQEDLILTASVLVDHAIKIQQSVSGVSQAQAVK